MRMGVHDGKFKIQRHWSIVISLAFYPYILDAVSSIRPVQYIPLVTSVNTSLLRSSADYSVSLRGELGNSLIELIVDLLDHNRSSLLIGTRELRSQCTSKVVRCLLSILKVLLDDWGSGEAEDGSIELWLVVLNTRQSSSIHVYQHLSIHYVTLTCQEDC